MSSSIRGRQIYAGKFDFQCNWLHQLSWTSKLEWTGHDDFNAQPIEPWSVSSTSTTTTSSSLSEEEIAGEHRSFGGLSYVTVRGAGHSTSFLSFSVLSFFLRLPVSSSVGG